MARRFTLASSPNGAASPSPPRRIARPPAPRALPRLGARGTRRPSGGHLSPRGRLVLTICSQLAHVQGVYQGVLFKMRRTVCGSRCLAGGARSTVARQASRSPSRALFHHTEGSALSGLYIPSPPLTGPQEMLPRRLPSTASAGASGAAVAAVAAAAAPAARATSTRVARTRAAQSEPRWRPEWSLPPPLPPRLPLPWPSLS